MLNRTDALPHPQMPEFKMDERSGRIEVLREFAQSYLSRYDPTQNHLRSYNHAVLEEIPKLIGSRNRVEHVTSDGVVHQICFTNLNVRPPSYRDTVSRTNGFLPEHAELLAQNYCIDYYCTATYTVDGVEKEKIDEFLLVSIPCMVGSSLCNRKVLRMHSALDNKIPDGCFVVGSLRVIPPLKRAIWNVPLIRYYPSDHTLTLELRSCHHSRQSYSTYNTSLSITHSGPKYSILQKELTVQLSFFNKKSSVKVIVLFNALGLDTKQAYEMIKFNLGDEWDEEIDHFLKLMLIESRMLGHDDRDFDMVNEAMYLIGECSTRPSDHGREEENRISLRRNMNHEFLPQVGIPEYYDGSTEEERNNQKCFLLSWFVAELILVELGRKEMKSRDSFELCRMDSVGTLISSLFRMVYSQNVKQSQRIIQKIIAKQGIVTIGGAIGDGKSTARMSFCFSTGAWGPRGSGSTRKNVCQKLQTFNAQAQIGHMAFFYTTINKEGKHVSLRQLHPSQAFKICPTTTPEGEPCGLVSTGVCGFLLSKGSSASAIQRMICSSEHVMSINEAFTKGFYRYSGLVQIQINGTPVAFLNQKKMSIVDFYTFFSDMRSNLDIDPFASISYTTNSVHIFCDRDRVIRFVVKIAEIGRLVNFIKLQPSPIELVSQGLGIFLDANEEQVVSIAASLEDPNIAKYDFCEIDPTCMLSILAANIPYCNSNQAPRNTYQVAMGKQAAGGFLHRDVMLSQRFELSYPQRPLTNTMISKAFPKVFDQCGINCNIAIMTYEGYPQEDSCVINRDFLDRGGMMTSDTKYYKNLSLRGSSADRQYYGPLSRENTTHMKVSDYSKIDESGLPPIGTPIKKTDIVISKADREQKKGSSGVMRCMSTAHKGEDGSIDRTLCAFNTDSKTVRKVTVVSQLRPQIGDKFSSRHGQKCTAGAIVPSTDMPYDPITGVIPDMILPPTSFPSRMTVGQWQEIMSSKLAAVTGVPQDGTPFRTFQKNDIANQFRRLGVAPSCSSRLMDGRTGRMMNCHIYTGLVYIQVLRQRSASKIHARHRGPRNILTRAPLEGRSRDGGQRCGLMERDALLSYGASSLIHSLMLLRSDVHKAYFCGRCGFKAVAHLKKGIFECRACGPYGEVREVKMSRAFDVLLDELQALMISARVQLRDLDVMDQGEEWGKSVEITRPSRTFTEHDRELLNKSVVGGDVRQLLDTLDGLF